MMRRPRDPKRGGSPGRKPGAENKATSKRAFKDEMSDDEKTA